jgi:hypothetical protein
VPKKIIFSLKNKVSYKLYRHNSFQLVQCIPLNIHSYYKPNKKIHYILYIQTSHYIILWCILLAKWGKKSTADNKNSCLEISKHVTTIHIASLQTNHYKYIIPQNSKNTNLSFINPTLISLPSNHKLCLPQFQKSSH